MSLHDVVRYPWLPAACRLRASGKTGADIATELGKSPSTITNHLPHELLVLSSYDLMELRKAAVAVDAVPRFVEERQEARRASAAIRRFRRSFRRRPYTRRPLSLNHPIDTGDGSRGQIQDGLADPSLLGRDPFELLTGTHEHLMSEVLGDLTEEDVSRMGEWELVRLRERILEAGLPSPTIQRGERERLKNTTPHHGCAPSRTGRVGMAHQTKHRTQRDRSTRHKSVDKRYKRRAKESTRDGWGGVVLPEEVAA